MKNILLTATFSIIIVTLFLAPAGTNLAFAGVTCEEECEFQADAFFEQCLEDNPDEVLPDFCIGPADEFFFQCVEQCPPIGECLEDIDCGASNACQFNTCQGGICVSAALFCDDLDACTDNSCDPVLGCTFTPSNDPICQPTPVAGELLPLDSTALLLAGIQSMTVWMVPTVLGLAGAGVYLVKFRKQ